MSAVLRVDQPAAGATPPAGRAQAGCAAGARRARSAPPRRSAVPAAAERAPTQLIQERHLGARADVRGHAAGAVRVHHDDRPVTIVHAPVERLGAATLCQEATQNDS